MTLQAVTDDYEGEQQLSMFESKPIAQYLINLQGVKEFPSVLAGSKVELHHGDRITIQVEAEVEDIHLPEKRKVTKLKDGTILRIPVGRLTRRHIAKAFRASLIALETAEPPDPNLYGERREG